jgi:hypothetical protein
MSTKSDIMIASIGRCLWTVAVPSEGRHALVQTRLGQEARSGRT